MKAFTIYEDKHLIESLVIGEIAVTLIEQLKKTTNTLDAYPIQLII